MNRSSFAFFVALLIHLVIILAFWLLGVYAPPLKQEPSKDENKIKISLKDLPPLQPKQGKKVQKKPQKKQQHKVPKIAPPMPKGTQLKKIVKSQPVHFQKNMKRVPKLNDQHKIVKKQVATKKIEKLPPDMPYIPLLENPKKDINITKKEHKDSENTDPLYALLSQDKSDEEKEVEKNKQDSGNSVGQDIKELYGVDFGKLSQSAQKYLLDNREVMRRITQQILNRQASVSSQIQNIHVNRVNIIEFNLHPNGDMTDFKFLKGSGYYELDDITKATIEFAYSKYPRPKETTLIRYKIYYQLAGGY